MSRVSAYILTRNEEEKIEAAVSSVLWADEIVVADSGSTDRTVAIAESYGARVVQIPFRGFGDLRNQAIEACQFDWIFSLDADERCTPAVRDEILELIAGDPAQDAFLVPRRNFFMGRWLRGAGWYPDYRQPQLFRKGSMRYTQRSVHEGYELLTKRPLGRLRNNIWQVPFRNLDQILAKVSRYSTLGAQELAPRRVTMLTAFNHGAWAFFRHFFLKRGFRDGWAGFVIALGNFEGTFYRYAKRYEAMQDWQPPAQAPVRRDQP
jgi:glycosyltransferase involved in cell wall biosynthesis